MKTKLFSLLLVLTMLLSLAACDTGTSEPPAETSVFTDDVGREVEVPVEVDRIVPSGSLAQIILFAIAPDLFAGLANSFYDEARGIIDDQYFDLPYFGSLYAGADLNVEELALAEPDVLIDIGDSKDGVKEDLEDLQAQTGIPSVFVYATLETMPETFRTLGKLLGREERGEELAMFCERVYGRTVSIMEEVGENKVNGLYVLGEEGLNVLAQGTYHAELLDLLMNNLAVVDNPMSKGSGNEVTMEQIAVWNPEFVVFGSGSIYETVGRMDVWSEIPAIVNGDYVEVPDKPHNWMSMPPSAQRFLSLIWLTAELYPDYCDYDVKAEITECFRLFFGCELTDAQYEDLMKNAICR